MWWDWRKPVQIYFAYRRKALITDSKENYVPVDRGILRSSGHAQLPQQVGQIIYVDVGYGGAAAPYALSVHENPRAGHTGGVSPSGRRYKHWAATGGYKYLERPFQQRSKGMSKRIQADILLRIGRPL